MNDVHFSHQTDEWATPAKFFAEISAEFGPFDIDVCASAANAKCARYFDRSANGLEQDLGSKNWCNPPYSAAAKWVLKARREQLKGNVTVMLLFARTDTRYFHDSIYNKPNVAIRFIKGRLKFGSSRGDAPAPSMLVIFKPHV